MRVIGNADGDDNHDYEDKCQATSCYYGYHAVQSASSEMARLNCMESFVTLTLLVVISISHAGAAAACVRGCFRAGASTRVDIT